MNSPFTHGSSLAIRKNVSMSPGTSIIFRFDAANHAPQYIQNNCDLEHGKIRISVCVLIH